jgi:hypothetical protein
MCNVKNGCAIAWLNELSGPKNALFCSTAVNAFDRSTLFVYGFMIFFVKRYWALAPLFYFGIGVMAWLTILFLIPESPSWHMFNDRNEEAIKNLN